MSFLFKYMVTVIIFCVLPECSSSIKKKTFVPYSIYTQLFDNSDSANLSDLQEAIVHEHTTISPPTVKNYQSWQHSLTTTSFQKTSDIKYQAVASLLTNLHRSTNVSFTTASDQKSSSIYRSSSISPLMKLKSSRNESESSDRDLGNTTDLISAIKPNISSANSDDPTFLVLGSVSNVTDQLNSKYPNISDHRNANADDMKVGDFLSTSGNNSNSSQAVLSPMHHDSVSVIPAQSFNSNNNISSFPLVIADNYSSEELKLTPILGSVLNNNEKESLQKNVTNQELNSRKAISYSNGTRDSLNYPRGEIKYNWTKFHSASFPSRSRESEILRYSADMKDDVITRNFTNSGTNMSTGMSEPDSVKPTIFNSRVNEEESVNITYIAGNLSENFNDVEDGRINYNSSIGISNVGNFVNENNISRTRDEITFKDTNEKNITHHKKSKFKVSRTINTPLHVRKQKSKQMNSKVPKRVPSRTGLSKTFHHATHIDTHSKYRNTQSDMTMNDDPNSSHDIGIGGSYERKSLQNTKNILRQWLDSSIIDLSDDEDDIDDVDDAEHEWGFSYDDQHHIHDWDEEYDDSLIDKLFDLEWFSDFDISSSGDESEEDILFACVDYDFLSEIFSNGKHSFRGCDFAVDSGFENVRFRWKRFTIRAPEGCRTGSRRVKRVCKKVWHTK